MPRWRLWIKISFAWQRSYPRRVAPEAFRVSSHRSLAKASVAFWLKNFGSNRDGPLNQSSHMALPVHCGPNRCALVYSQDRQPLIELSLRVNLPVVELLQALSQVAPRAAEPAPPRSSLAQQRGNPNYGSGPHDATVRKQERPSPSAWAEWYPNSEWQPAPEQPNSSARHSWEPCPLLPPWDGTNHKSALRKEKNKCSSCGRLLTKRVRLIRGQISQPLNPVPIRSGSRQRRPTAHNEIPPKRSCCGEQGQRRPKQTTAANGKGREGG